MTTPTRTLAYRIRRSFEFEAGLVLRGLRPDHAASTPHGHSYRVEVECVGLELDETGFLLDMNLIASLKERLDHTFLNAEDVQEGWKRSPLPKGLNPTLENLARWVYEELNTMILRLEAVDDVKVERVAVYVGKNAMAEIVAVDS